MIHRLTPALEMSEIPTLDERAVVVEVLAGNREAYAILVRHHQERLFRFACGMVGSGDAAADLVQESFVKAYMTLDQCRDPARFGAWVHRIVRNRCLDHLKRHRRRSSLELALSREVPETVADESLDAGDLRAALASALGELPVAQREAFLMKHLEDRSYEEMSGVLGTSISALKMRVKRAREALREVLRESYLR